MEEPPLSDGELAGLAASGDRRAFDRLHERHLPGLHDFAVRVVRDRRQAARAVKTAAGEARTGLVDGRARGSPKAWLYATLHGAALDAVLAEGLADDDPALSFAPPGGDGEAVWGSAAELPPADYALLDLHLRRGLGADELAVSLGVARGALARRLTRLQAELGAGANGLDASAAAAVFAELGPVEPAGPRVPRRLPSTRWLRIAIAAAVVVAATTGAVLGARGGGVDDPAELTSSSHRIGQEGANVVAVSWSPGTGRGYSILWTQDPEGQADETVDLPASATSAESDALASGRWWFVLRTHGGGDDWSGGIRLGPFVVPEAAAAQLDQRPPAASPSPRATFAFSASEEDASFECALDGAAFEPCESPRRFRRLEQGEHTLAVRATGISGVAGEPTVHEWTVDTRAPRTRFTDKPPAATRSKTARLRFAANEPDVRFRCKLDDSPWHTCRSPQSLANLTEARHRFAVKARDHAGNVDETPVLWRWVVDRTRPDTSISGRSGPTGRTARFTLGASESGVSFRCSLDGAAFSSCSSSLVLSGLSAGRHTLSILARDAAGNADATPAERRWRVDASRPGTLLTQHPPSVTRSKTATFAFAATEGGVRFECSLDGRTFASCTSPIVYIGLTPGPHVFAVRARDRAGNVDDTPVTWRWRVR
ncbi:MAG: hypothetical protein ACRDNI_02460 [Gaiellaceae bacterium]